MDFTQALKQRLLADSGVKALTTQLHWGAVPQNTPLPYVRLTVISQTQEDHLEGYAAQQEARVQVDCMAAKHGEARAIANAIKAAVALPASVGGIQFNYCPAEGPRESGEDVGQERVFLASVDLLARFSS